MGRPSSAVTAMAAPPLAVPSILVRKMPVSPENFRNSRAWRTAFWPTVASRTSRDSIRASGSYRTTTRRTFSSSAMRFAFVWMRPAVSTRSTSPCWALNDWTASKTTEAGSAP